MATLIQPIAKTLILIGGHIDKEKPLPSNEPYFLVTTVDSFPIISALTSIILRNSQLIMELANKTNKTDDQVEDIFI